MGRLRERWTQERAELFPTSDHSTALNQLARWLAQGFLTKDDVAGLSPEARASVQVIPDQCLAEPSALPDRARDIDPESS
jgi:hypothetical protein